MATNINPEKLMTWYGIPLSKVIIGGVLAEASVSEKHDISGDVTSHPVEEGIDITDNYRAIPREITIEGVISNTALLEFSEIADDPDVIDPNKKKATGNKTPVQEAWVRFKQIVSNEEIITIETSLELYTSMAITSLAVVRGSHNGDNLRFTMSAKEVRFVSTEYAKAIKLPKTTRGQKKKDTESDTNEDANAAEEDAVRKTNLLCSGIDDDLYPDQSGSFLHFPSGEYRQSVQGGCERE